MRYKAIATPDGGVTQQLSTSEETARDAEEAEWAAGQVSRDAEEEILRLENEISARRVRDSILTVDGKTWLTNKEAEIASQRSKL